MKLVSAIRIFLESSNKDDILLAERLLEKFCEELVKLHDNNERIETIKIHSLRHLADQVKRFGPLVCFSAMVCEAANRTLGEVFSGANSELEVICRRVLQRHRLTESDITDARLRHFFCKLTGKECYEGIDFNDELIVTEAIEAARLQYEGCVNEIFNRHIEKDIYLDSISYKRSKFGNCYANFQEKNRQFSF